MASNWDEAMIVASSAREAIAEAYERGRQAGKTEADASLRDQAGRLVASIEALIAHAAQYDDARMRRIRDRAALPMEGYCGISASEAENILEAREALASSPTLAEEWRKREAVIAAALEWRAPTLTSPSNSDLEDGLREAVDALAAIRGKTPS